jgi:hypothetical protein
VLLAEGANPCGPTCESTFSYNTLCFELLNFSADSPEARLLREAAAACATDAPVGACSVRGDQEGLGKGGCVVLGVVVHRKLEAKADVVDLILRLAAPEEMIDTCYEDARCLDYLHFYNKTVVPALNHLFANPGQRLSMSPQGKYEQEVRTVQKVLEHFQATKKVAKGLSAKQAAGNPLLALHLALQLLLPTVLFSLSAKSTQRTSSVPMRAGAAPGGVVGVGGGCQRSKICTGCVSCRILILHYTTTEAYGLQSIGTISTSTSRKRLIIPLRLPCPLMRRSPRSPGW